VIYDVNAALIITGTNDILHVLMTGKIMVKNKRVAGDSKRENEYPVKLDRVILF
jgi:hypothetical protein